MMTPAMMTNERKIWEAVLTCVVWCWIARSTAELLRPIPGEDERVH
jgi:hypothetical protein